MQDASGILRQPVQKLAASIRFCPTGQNRWSSPISSTKTKKSELVPDGTGSDFLFLSEMLHIDFHACAPLSERGTGAFFFADLQNSNVKRLSCQIFDPPRVFWLRLFHIKWYTTASQNTTGAANCTTIYPNTDKLEVYIMEIWVYPGLNKGAERARAADRNAGVRDSGKSGLYGQAVRKGHWTKNYKRLIRKLKKDDTLVVKSIDRLGRMRICLLFAKSCLF